MDVKVYLVDYMKYCNKEKDFFLNQHLQSIKNQIKRLRQKNYTDAYQLKGLDFVLLLVSMERVFAVAVEQGPTRFEETYSKNIVLVSPTTLRATLCMIDHIWKHAYRNKHAADIACKSGDIYTKFVNFVDDLAKVRHQLNLGKKACNMAFNKRCEGRGNLLQKVEQLKRWVEEPTKN